MIVVRNEFLHPLYSILRLRNQKNVMITNYLSYSSSLPHIFIWHGLLLKPYLISCTLIAHSRQVLQPSETGNWMTTWMRR